MGLSFFKKHIPLEKLKMLGQINGGKVIYSHGSNDSRGVMIAFREGLDIKIENEIEDTNGRVNIYNANVEKEQSHTPEMLDSLIDKVNVSHEIRDLKKHNAA